MSHLNIASEASYVTFWVDKSSLKMPKMINFCFWKTLRSNSVTRCYIFTGQKFIKNAKKWSILASFWKPCSVNRQVTLKKDKKNSENCQNLFWGLCTPRWLYFQMKITVTFLLRSCLEKYLSCGYKKHSWNLKYFARNPFYSIISVLIKKLFFKIEEASSEKA